MKALPILISGIALLTLAFIVVGAGPSERDGTCDTCHTGTLPDGDYTVRRPTVSVSAPSEVEHGASFQVMISMRENEPYGILRPQAVIDISDLEGATMEWPVSELVYDGGRYTAIFQIDDLTSGGSVVIWLDYTLYYDHSGAEEDDTGDYRERREVEITVKEASKSPRIEDDGNDTPAPPLHLLLLASLIVPVLSVRRRLG